MVLAEDKAIASGLAAAETVEMAEDRARERAIALINPDLNVNFSSGEKDSPQKTSISRETLPQLDSKATSAHNESTVKQNLASTHELISVESSKATIKNQNKSSSPQKSLASEELPLIYENPSAKKTESSPPSQPSEEFSSTLSAAELNSHLTPSEENEAIAQTNPDLESNHSHESLNWDLISRTDIELKRLGWTQDQGRNYLLETYGKKSRHLLSDEELIEFCHYLESQPNSK
jgi:hypothetical protein